MNYYLTIASIGNKTQKTITSDSGYVDADNKSEAYNKILDKDFLERLFEKIYPDISYDEIVVLFCKVW